MLDLKVVHILMAAVFIAGYLAIIFEYYIKVNKTASAMLMAVGTWILLFTQRHLAERLPLSIFDEHIGNASQIIFFLLGAMTLVELIDVHRGFKIITDIIHTNSKKKMLWLVGVVSFFLSALLDNLTTTIIMVSVLRKIIDDPKDRLILCGAIVVAANAGGAWTPIGDVTTTMLWIKGQVTTVAVMKTLFLPSLFCAFVSLFLLSLQVKGKYENLFAEKSMKQEPGAKIVFYIGVGALVFVPIFRGLTGLPPFMGILVGLGVLWFVTDIMHHKYASRKYLRVPHVLTKIDTSGVLFFLGILLSISALEIIGILKNVAVWVDFHITNTAVIATVIGLLSSIVDNVPLVAACIGMYPLEIYPPDSSIWQMLAYCAGTGGSILVIGSAAGVALMGLEKIDFIWYLKKISLTALTGFLAGMALYLLLSAL
jgi:NhaD family Na+/H+ antiporter